MSRVYATALPNFELHFFLARVGPTPDDDDDDDLLIPIISNQKDDDKA